MTLYHWDLPYELQTLGGWLNRDTAKWFGEYAQLLFKEFADRVPLFATINEPIATYMGYATGLFAPGLKSEAFGKQANHNILRAHGEGVGGFPGVQLPKQPDRYCGRYLAPASRAPGKRRGHCYRIAGKRRIVPFLFESGSKRPLLGVFAGKMERDGTMPEIGKAT